MLDNGRIFSHDLYTVKKLDEPRLGGPAIKALKILGEINATKNESNRYKKTFQEYSKSLENWKTYTKYTWMRQPNRFLSPPQKTTTPYERKSRKLQCM